MSQPPRTSLSHPLQIAEVTPPASSGRIGITFCPGKIQPAAMSGAWTRDLAIDLDAIRAWGAATVITLVETWELADLGVAALGTDVTSRGMAWLHLPIPDAAVPDARFEASWASKAPQLHATLDSGGRILVHCKGGLGRAGTIAARLLVECGSSADGAIASVRAARTGAIETRGQEAYIHELAHHQAHDQSQAQAPAGTTEDPASRLPIGRLD